MSVEQHDFSLRLLLKYCGLELLERPQNPLIGLRRGNMLQAIRVAEVPDTLIPKNGRGCTWYVNADQIFKRGLVEAFAKDGFTLRANGHAHALAKARTHREGALDDLVRNGGDHFAVSSRDMEGQEQTT